MELLSHYSDSTMADAFVERHQHDVRFVPKFGWMIRDLSTMGWEKTDEGVIVNLSDRLARDALSSVYDAMAVEHFRAAEARLNYYPIKNVVRLVKKRPPILAERGDFDFDLDDLDRFWGTSREWDVKRREPDPA